MLLINQNSSLDPSVSTPTIRNVTALCSDVPRHPKRSDLFLTLSLQADAIYDMIGFPEFILDQKELDDVYDGVSDGFRTGVLLTLCS